MKPFASLAVGQLISIQLALLSTVTKLMANAHPQQSLPGLQNVMGFLLLFALSFAKLCLHDRVGLFSASKWSILALLFITTLDTTAGFLNNLSFYFNVSLASLTLLSSFTIPCAMLLSFLLLHVRYAGSHMCGITLAMFGFACVLHADDSLITSAEHISPDLMVLIAAMLYAGSNVLSELFLHEHLQISLYLTWISVLGLFVSILQMVMNRELVWELPWTVWTYLAIHTVLFSTVYWSIGYFFAQFDAVGLNLNLLTTGLFGMGFGFQLFHEPLSLIKIVGYLFVVSGIVWYSKHPPITITSLTNKKEYEPV